MRRRRPRWRLAPRTGKGPIRIVLADTLGTVKSVWSCILEGLGDPHYATGSEPLLKKRLRKALTREGIELIIIDEFNHVAEERNANRVVNAIKNLLSAGWVSVVICGTSTELDSLPSNPGFSRRMVKHPGLPPRVWGQPADAASWTKFVLGLDEGMVERGILDERSNLDAPLLAEALCNLCDGLVGQAHWIIQESMKDAVRRGRSCIGREDLSANAEAWLIKNGRFGEHNTIAALPK